MTTINFSIVGIVNYVDKDCLKVFYERMVEQDVILMLEPDNVYDVKAVAVYHEDQIIGHVRKSNAKDIIYLVVKSTPRKCCSAKVLKKSDTFDSLEALLEYAGDMPKVEDCPIINWGHCWEPLKPIEEWVDLDRVMKSMLTLLDEGKATKDNMLPYVKKFKENAIFGFSIDFFNDRQMLYQKLQQNVDTELQSLANEIASLSSIIHCEKKRSDAMGHILKGLKKQVANLDTPPDYDTGQIVRQLKSFPGDLYISYIKKFGLFPTILYYMQLSRQDMITFLSGLAIIGYAERGKKKSTTKKRRGPQKKADRGKDAFLSHINGTSKIRREWLAFFSEMLQGKRNKEAARVMSAAVECRVIDSAPFADGKSTFPNIGNKEDYNNGMRYFKEHLQELEYYIDIFNNKRKEIL